MIINKIRRKQRTKDNILRFWPFGSNGTKIVREFAQRHEQHVFAKKGN